MNIILGFGSTEKEFEKQELDFVREFVAEKAKGDDDFHFSDYSVDELGTAIDARAEEYARLDKSYKDAADFPGRYSMFRFTVLHDLFNVCVIFDFWHTNRKHPMSKDGWALLRSKEVLHLDAWDYR